MEGLTQILAGLDPQAAPRLALVRQAVGGLGGEAGTLLCLDASFNPPTAAHMALVAEAARILPPGEILLTLATANVDKAVVGFPLARRLTFLLRIAETRPAVSVGAVSHGRFVDKAAAIRPHYPPGTRLVFLLGFDTLVRLFDPRYYTDPGPELAALFSAAECVAANRAPDPPEAVHRFLARPEVRPHADRIHVVQLPDTVAAISASRVRARLARGESVADLVPPEIAAMLTGC
jgi:nicotinic acid mononucleotide adenylyltransferase